MKFTVGGDSACNCAQALVLDGGGTISSSRVIAGLQRIFLFGNYLGVRPGLRAGEELLLPVQLDGQDPTCWNQLSQSSI
jgi:hypothetical protein